MPAYVFVLVHGTFAPNAAWASSEESALRTSLKNSFTRELVSFDPFVWKGLFDTRLNNAHRYRVRAGRKLSERLSQIHEDNPNALIFVLAHSHGGNVALYAASQPSCKGKISGIVCMATPYFVVSENGFISTAYHSWSTVFQALWALGGFIYIPVFLAIGFIGFIGHFFQKASDTLLFVLGISSFSLALAICYGAIWIIPRLWNIANRVFDEFSSKTQRYAELKLQARLPPSTPTLCILAIGDEVRLAFKALHTFLDTMQAPSILILWAASTIAIISAVELYLYKVCFASMIEEFQRATSIAPIAHLTFWPALIIQPLIVAVIFSVASYSLYAFTHRIVSRIRTLAYGWEGIGETFFSSIEARPIPKDHDCLLNATEPAIHEIRNYNIQAKLRHSSLYDNPTVLSDIVNWIRRASDKSMPECPACLSEKKPVPPPTQKQPQLNSLDSTPTSNKGPRPFPPISGKPNKYIT